jgi:A/G-specific adenine glycosylase
MPVAAAPLDRLTPGQITAFRRKILSFYRRHGRKLPFRQTTDPYCITVAEIMLQQTQVDRVVPKYEAWVARWPDWESLAGAANRQLLTMWSGLGYNRRALNLGALARNVIHDYHGRLPDDPRLLQTLPGIGPYTAHAILIFAFNRPLVTIDTNIRRVLVHSFELPPSVTRQQLQQLAEKLLPRRRARDWHNALMDYASLALPHRLPGVPARGRQPRFEGSRRQVRGEIIRQLTKHRSVAVTTIAHRLDRSVAEVEAAAAALVAEGMVVRRGRFLHLC